MSSKIRLPPLPSLRDFIRIYGLNPRRVLSQNYLMDMQLARKVAYCTFAVQQITQLVRAAGPLDDSTVLEVGPGPGSITRALLELPIHRLDVLELDRRFFPPLQLLVEASNNRMRIHHGDVLKFDVGGMWDVLGGQKVQWIDLPPKMHIIGNLPFNISTPLIIQWLRAMSEREGPWRQGRVSLTLTFQKEVAERMVAPLDHPRRSRLSIMCQYLTKPRLVFTIPGQCFSPTPLVDVGVVTFEPLEEPVIRAPFSLVEKMVRHLFHYRQKRVLKPAKTLYPTDLAGELADELFRKCRIDPTLTSFQLGLDDFRDICYVYEEQCHRYPGLLLFDYCRPEPLSILATKPGSVPVQYPFSLKSLPSDGVSLSDFGSLQSRL